VTKGDEGGLDSLFQMAKLIPDFKFKIEDS